jgi:regulator of protease activity HflC (stomatin/prohibitin superfamily)
MMGWIIAGIAIVAVLLLSLSMKIVKQYEQGVLFRLGQVRGSRMPGLRLIIPFVDVLHRVTLRIITLPIQSQGIITRTTSASMSPRSPTSRWSTR